MEENNVIETSVELEQLNKNKDRLKVLIIASIILFAFDILSLIFSLISKPELVIEAKEIGYIIVAIVCLVVFVLSLVMFNKTKKQVSEMQDK